MPQYQLVDNETGRELLVESDSPPTEAEVSRLFQNHDAFKVAIAGPKGSEERRRAMAQEVAAQSQKSFEDASGGSTASTGITMPASLGRSLSNAGTGIMVGAARGFELLKEGLGSPEGGFTTVNPEINPATRSAEQIEQDVAGNRLYQQAKELEDQAKVTYPVNPDKPWANLPGQALGSAAQMLATGPARIPAYAMTALGSGTEEALAAGATPAQAQAQGLVEGAMGGISEKLLGLAPFLKEVGGKNLREVARMGGRAVAKTVGQEVVQEPTEGILNRLSSKYVTGANPNETVFDPETLAMEAAGGAIGAAGIQIPTIGAARIQRSHDVNKRRDMGLAGRMEPRLQAELEAFNQGIHQSQLAGEEGALVQRAPNNQLDLSERNAPPQFQMITSEAPRTARSVGQRLTDSGLREPDGLEFQTPIDQLLSQPTQAQPAANQLGQLEQSRQAQFPVGGAFVQPEQPQSIQPQGDLMERLRDARKTDLLRQPSPMSVAQLGDGQPVGGPPASNDLTPFLLAYEAQAQAQAPVAVAPVAETPARPVTSNNVNLRAKSQKPKKPSQTITGSNGETAPVMPVQPQAQAQAGEAPLSRDISKPEQMTPDEFNGNDLASAKYVEEMGKLDARGVNPPPREFMLKAATMVAHKESLQGAAQARSPVSAEAVDTYGIKLPAGYVRQGDLYVYQPISRSEPAAAQGIATEGAATSAPSGVAVFGGRRYGSAPFIDGETYNAVRSKVDEGLQSGDEIAKRIDYFENAAEVAMGTASGYFALTKEGQQKAIVGFQRKLYQSAKRWADGEEFKFAPQVIARSMASDIGKSNEEKMRKATQSGESSDEGGVETQGAFERVSDATLPKKPLKAPPKVKEEIILSMVNLQRQLNATKTQFANVMMAYKDPSFEESLDDEELGMLEKSRPMLGRLDNLKFSVSSLIAEPIGQARAQQAVDKWRLETGATETRIQVVDDPGLTTPDGRPVAAMVETRPGELPIITLNAAHLSSEEEVREKLWHEALHPVWNDPSVQKAWGDVVNSLPSGSVQAELARGYSPLEATMEAAINAASSKAANTKVRTAWQKFLDAVWAAMGRVFGFDTKPKDFEQLMESALQSLSRPYNQAPSTQYAGQLTQQDANYLAAVQRGDMETAQRMVDEAAKAAGYDVGPVYHGTNADFTEFSQRDAGRNSGGGEEFFFTSERDTAALYGRPRKFYLKEATQNESFFNVADPNQIKSADPVTYDESGNPIPLSRRFQQDNPDIRYSVANSFAMAKNPTEIQQRLETSSDPESLLAMGKGAASLITLEFQELVKSVEDAKPGTAEAAMRTYLKRAGQLAQTGEAVVEWGQTHETPIPAFKSIGDLPAEWQGVVGNAMTGAHFALGQQVKSIDRAIEKTAGELTVVGADFSEADEKRLVAEATRSEAKRLLKDLMQLIEVERNKLGTSSAKATGEEVARAAQTVGRVDRGLIAALANGIEIMAREMPIGGFASNEDALNWLKTRQSKNPIFGDKAMEAYDALTKALERKPDQTKRIEQIRALTLDNVDAVRQVGELSKLLGKNKANTIKTYAKLRADYESAFRQFKGLSDTMDRLSNRMDGLLRAKEELVKLTSSPEYNAKLADVFGNGKTMLSGLMAQMTERGQPNGVVEFCGPSAYKANGGIKTGGNVGVYGDPSFEKRDGLIYRIDWKPDFAIEKKNVEAIGALLDEIVDALNNPESKNYLSDPLARASYERVFNYVAKFLVDNRYLTEQQWGDSLLLKGMKLGGNVGGGGLPGVFMSWGSRLYTTRMNAAKASGGRGGVAWEEANKAVDSFEKKSENTLRDTRTENAVARRAAIESHQLNPDDPMDVETWSAHNSLVLGSMQNPSQDQLREGDYVGGLRVTKEDLRSARIQKQFSTGVVLDFNNMATSFAEVVNPEEEIGGILFTRAAEDYGMKTRREFSLWGREFSGLWEIATEKDLKAFRVKQDSATGNEPVGMVWDEREKLANHKIDGPVYSHIAETNSEFTSGDSNQLKAAFAKIRKDLKAGRLVGLQTVDDIASYISDLTAGEDGEGGINPLEAKEELLKAIDRDVTGYLRASDDFSQSDIGGSNLPNAIMSVKAANGALAKARGKMVAPSWFYDYGIHDDYKRAGEVANGKRILLMKVYETMAAYRGAVKRKLDDAKREIRENAAKMGRDGKPAGLAKAEKEYDRKAGAQYNEGSVFATRRGLEKTLTLVDGQLEGLKGHLAGSSRMVVEMSLAIRGAKAFIGGFSSLLLSNGNSIINNLTSTTLDTYRTWQMTNRYGAGLMAIARANGRLARFAATDLFSMLPASLRNSFTKRRKGALLDTVAKTLEGLMGERQLMEASGLISSFESYSSIYQRIKANPLTFGVTRAPATGTAEKAASWLYSKAAFAVAMGSWVRERSPGYFDSLLNRVIATDANQFTEWLTPHLLDWARSLPGETVQEKFESAGQSTITPESMGVTKEGLALIRDYMSGAGSLETIAQRALQENGLSGLSKPNVLSSEERVAVQFDAGRKYNTRASSTSPDTAKGGAGISGVASNVLHMFMGWVLQRMGSDATQFLKFKGGGWKKELEVFWKVIQLFLVTLMAGALYKVPKDIWRFITGNPATTPNILQAIESPEMGLRYLAVSTAGVFPLGAELLGEVMGGTGISSPFNNNFLDNNPIAGFMASVLASGKRIHQTGDLKYPLVDFARKNFWPAGAVMNYTMPGDVEARGATRAVRIGAGGMEVRPVGGGVGARETPTTPLVRDAVAALYEGNSANYQKAREKFVSYQIGQGNTQKEAERRFDSSVSGRDPLRSVLGRTPTEDEEATILRRLTPGQRSTVTKARSLFRKPKKIGLGRMKMGRKVRLGRKRPSRRRVRLRRAGA